MAVCTDGALPRNNYAVKPNYGKWSEVLRRRTPVTLICRTFCGGRRCRFDSTDPWTSADMAVDGIYSHWVTEDLLAMARPNTDVIRRKEIIDQFAKLGIKSVINLQIAGEHSFCGPALKPSGFTYNPEELMENGIFFYNFGWKDYGQGTLNGLLDAVKVLDFALTQGKVAVHCHAGLGRTGVLLSCFLVYSRRWDPTEAIQHAVLALSTGFTYSNGPAMTAPTVKSLADYLVKQKEMLHGYERRALRYIPKVVYVICERLVELCQIIHLPDQLDYSLNDNCAPFTRFFYCTRFDNSFVSRRLAVHCGTPAEASASVTANQKMIVSKVYADQVVSSLLLMNTSAELLKDPIVADQLWKLDSRQPAWMSLADEDQPFVLSSLLWCWFLLLKEPLLDKREIHLVNSRAGDPGACFAAFDQATRYTIEYLLRFVQRLFQPPAIQRDLLHQLANALTQRTADSSVDSPSTGVSEEENGQLAALLSGTLLLLNPNGN